MAVVGIRRRLRQHRLIQTRCTALQTRILPFWSSMYWNNGDWGILIGLKLQQRAVAYGDVGPQLIYGGPEDVINAVFDVFWALWMDESAWLVHVNIDIGPGSADATSVIGCEDRWLCPNEEGEAR